VLKQKGCRKHLFIDKWFFFCKYPFETSELDSDIPPKEEDNTSCLSLAMGTAGYKLEAALTCKVIKPSFQDNEYHKALVIASGSLQRKHTSAAGMKLCQNSCSF